MKKVYIACPYSDEDPEVMSYRYDLANRMAAKLMLQGYLVFSPLSHSVPIEPHLPVAQNDHDFWLKQDFAWLKYCDELHVLMAHGWEKSFGVAEEIKFATRCSMPIVYHTEGDAR